MIRLIDAEFSEFFNLIFLTVENDPPDFVVYYDGKELAKNTIHDGFQVICSDINDVLNYIKDHSSEEVFLVFEKLVYDNLL